MLRRASWYSLAVKPMEYACNNLGEAHNHGMITGLSRACGWSVRCACVVLALAFCASAFADPSKDVVVRPTQQQVKNTARKMCFVVESGSRIPQPCDRLAAIPTTANAMTIYGHRTGR